MAVLRPSLENLRALGNFTQTFRWHVNFITIPSAVSGFNAMDVNFRAESMSRPARTSNAVETSIRGHKTVQPGIVDYKGNSLSLTVVEAIDMKMATGIQQWQELCWESANGSSGITNMKADLEAEVLLTLLDNMDTPIWEYDCIGVWMKTGGEGDSDATTDDPLKPAMELAFDYYTDKPV